MTAKTVKTAAFVAATANVPAIIPAHENTDFMGRFVTMSAAEREAALLTLTFGEVAALGVKYSNAAESANKVMAMKLTSKHGAGWADRKYGGRVLSDSEKVERDALKADLEIIRSAAKVAGHSNVSMVERYIREWAQGKRGQPRDANTNKARTTAAWLKDTVPAMYKRLHKAEDVSETDMALADAMTVWLEANGINPRELLADK
jgi:hypothetical protein